MTNARPTYFFFAVLLLLGMVVAYAVGGFDVRSVDNGEEALECVQSERPDLILLDGMLPGMNGFEILRSLQDTPALQGIPVIFLTAQDREEDIVRGLTMGAIDYILKPFKPKELIARVSRGNPKYLFKIQRGNKI